LRGKDPLGLRRALADRLLPLLVAAMALLAALALGAAGGAAALAAHWRGAGEGTITLALPRGADVAGALARLRALPEVERAEALDAARLSAILAPWLGPSVGPSVGPSAGSSAGDEGPAALPLPLLVEVAGRAALDPARLAAAAGRGARAEPASPWVARIVRLADGLHALAVAVLGVVAAIAAALVAVATRAGIAARRETILILHELGARDADIAGRFAARLALLCGGGAAAGAALAVPALHQLAAGAVPLFSPRDAALADLPWGGLLLLPPAAALIGWLTAHVTVRRWLLRLP